MPGTETNEGAFPASGYGAAGAGPLGPGKSGHMRKETSWDLEDWERLERGADILIRPRKMLRQRKEKKSKSR